ncbi:unnamed protein product [Rotaria sp. Silwood1]|nr:unnamed protein product [Rotaria sp. Silwood1]
MVDANIAAFFLLIKIFCRKKCIESNRILSRTSIINDRYAANRQLAVEMNDKFQKSLKYFQFIQDCDNLKEWLDMKTLQAQDATYRDTANIHTKYLHHQKFQAEINSNKELDKNLIDQHIDELDNLWIQLEGIIHEKGERFFDANRSKLFQQSITNLEEFMLNIEKHLYAEKLLKSQQQVDELRIQTEKLKQLEPEKSEEIDTKRLQVEEKFAKLLLSLEQKKLHLEQQKHLHQCIHDIVDEQTWLSEKHHLLQTYSDLIFNNKQQALMNIKLLKRKNETLLKEIENHEQCLLEHLTTECIRISKDYPSQNLYQYYYDLSDAEAWLGEQKLYMMNKEPSKDELITQTFIRQQQTFDQTIENY